MLLEEMKRNISFALINLIYFNYLLTFQIQIVLYLIMLAYQSVLSSGDALTNGRPSLALPGAGSVVMVPIDGNQVVYRVR